MHPPAPPPLQVLHLFDSACALPISQIQLPRMMNWWPRLKEIYIQVWKEAVSAGLGRGLIGRAFL